MQFLKMLLGIALMIAGVYFLGKNIFFTTNASPYFWRGIAADASILLLMGGILSLFFLSSRDQFIGWGLIIAGVALVFVSSRAILKPTSLWQFFLSFAALAGGFRLMNGRQLFQ